MKKFSILIVLILFLYNCQKDVEQEVINKVELKPKPYLKVQGWICKLSRHMKLSTKILYLDYGTKKKKL